MSNTSVYEIVSNKIIEKLEHGVVPWKRPWVNGGAVNWKTQKSYRGINCWLLDDGEYATFKQISEAGGKVKKGEKSHIVVFWKMLDVQNKDSDKEMKIPLLKYYRVFDTNSQVEGLESKRKEKTFEHNPIEEAEKVVNGYINKPTITYERKGTRSEPYMVLALAVFTHGRKNIRFFLITRQASSLLTDAKQPKSFEGLFEEERKRKLFSEDNNF